MREKRNKTRKPRNQTRKRFSFLVFLLILLVLVFIIILLFFKQFIFVNRNKYEVDLSSVNEASSGLLYPEDFVYKGAFRFPSFSDWQSYDRWGYGATSLSYSPVGDPRGQNDGYYGSLFGTGHVYAKKVSEISIPSPVNSKNLETLPVANSLQSFTDITEGLTSSYSELDSFGGLAYVPAQGSQKKDLLYWSWYTYYAVQSPGNIDFPSFGSSELDLSKVGDALGLWKVGPYGEEEYNQKRTSRYMFDIPLSWANKYTPGKTIMAGKGDGAGNVANSHGPTMIAFTPISTSQPPVSRAVLDAQILVNYPPSGNYFPDWTACDAWTGASWVKSGGKEAIVVVGRKGLGKECYGSPDISSQYCYDPCDLTKGYHCYPYETQFLLYNPQDLAEVAQGRKQPYEVVPYAVYKPAEHLLNPSCPATIGVASDRERGILYTAESNAENPIVHTFILDKTSSNAVCGDGVVQGIEQCDDKNNVNGDGCSATCKNEIKKGDKPFIRIYSPEEGKIYKNRPVFLKFIISGADSCSYELDSAKLGNGCDVKEVIKILSYQIEKSEPHIIKVSATNINGVSELVVKFNYLQTRKAIIKYYEFRGIGKTTNLDDLTDKDLENVSLVLDNDQGRIEFSKSNLAKGIINDEIDLDSYIDISQAKISVNSEKLTELNKPANLIFYNIVFDKPKILRDGVECNGCKIINYDKDKKELIIEVSGFSIYEIVEGKVEEPPPQPPGGNGGGNGGGGSIIEILKKPKNETKINMTGIVNKSIDLQRVYIGESVSLVNISSGNRFIFNLDGSENSVLFEVIGSNVILKGLASDYKIEKGQVSEIPIGDRKIYASVKDSEEENIVIAIGTDGTSVKRELIEEVEDKQYLIFYLLVIVVVLLLIIIVPLSTSHQRFK